MSKDRRLTTEQALAILVEHGTWMTKGEILDVAGAIVSGAADVLQVLIDRGEVATKRLPKNYGSVLHYGPASLAETRGRIAPTGRPRSQVEWLEWGIAELSARPDQMSERDRVYLGVVIGQLRDAPMRPDRARLVSRCERLITETTSAHRLAVECGSLGGMG